MDKNLIDIKTNSSIIVEIILAIFSISFGIFLIFYIIPSQVLNVYPSHPNAKTFPLVIGWIYVLLSVAWLFNTLKAKKGEKELIDIRLLLKGLLIGCFFIIASFLVETVGYILGGAVATVSVIFAINGFKKWPLFAASGIFITIFYYLFFTIVMKIELNAGLLLLF